MVSNKRKRWFHVLAKVIFSCKRYQYGHPFCVFEKCMIKSFPGSPVSKESACSSGDPDLIPGSGRSPGEGNGNPFQYPCLEKSHGQRNLVGCSPWDAKNWAWLSDFTVQLDDSSFSSQSVRTVISVRMFSNISGHAWICMTPHTQRKPPLMFLFTSKVNLINK